MGIRFYNLNGFFVKKLAHGVYKNISIGPYTLKFVALVLFLGKYYE